MDDLFEEVDVIAQWEEKKNIESAKWQERKEALEALMALLEKNPRIATDSMTIYGEVVDNLRTILKSDSNIMVVSVAMNVIVKLAEALGVHFNAFVLMLFPHVLEKAKDKKQTANVGKALDAIAATCQPDKLTKDVVEHLWKPSPLSKSCIASFIYRYLTRQSRPPMEFLKTTVPLLVKLASDGDKNVREAALQAIGSAKRLLGAGISAFLDSISKDQTKMAKIEDALKQATEDWKTEMEAKGEVVHVDGTTQKNGQAGVPKENGAAAPDTSEEIDPWTLKDQMDVAAGQPDNWATLIASAKWSERKDAADWVAKAMEPEPKIMPSEKMVEMIDSLIAVLKKDLNVNVAAVTAKSLAGVAKGMRTDFAQYANKTIPICFDRLKEKKPILRDELVALVDASALTTKLTNVVEAVIGAMGNKNPQIRSQTCNFLRRLFEKHDKRTLPVGDVKHLIPVIQKCCSDGDGDVREGALRVVTILSKTLGHQVVSGLFPEIADDKVKMEKIEFYLKKYKEAPPLVVEPQLKKLYEGEVAEQLSKTSALGKKGFTARPAPRATPRTTPIKTAPPKSVQPKPLVSKPRLPVTQSVARVPSTTPSMPSVRPTAAGRLATRQPVALPANAPPKASTARVPIWLRTATPVSTYRPAAARGPIAAAPAPQRPSSVSRPAPIPTKTTPADVTTATIASATARAAPLSYRFGFLSEANRPSAQPAKGATTTARPMSARSTGIARPGSRVSSRPPSRPSSAMGGESNA